MIKATTLLLARTLSPDSLAALAYEVEMLRHTKQLPEIYSAHERIKRTHNI